MAVLAGLLVAPALAAPVLVLSPSSGSAGVGVTATGNGFNVSGLEFPYATIRFNGMVVAENVWFYGSGFSTSFPVPVGTSPGTYTVQAVGPRDAATATYTVAYPPDADFTKSPLSGMGLAPLTVYFTDRSTGNPTSWWWSFGDGGTSSLQHPSHQYQNTNTYTVTLTVYNAAGSSMETQEVIVYRPTLGVSPSSGKAGTLVTVTGNSFNFYNRENPQATISFNGISVASVPIAGNGTVNLGSFSASFPVPAGTATGSYIVRAIGPLDSVEATFTITNIAPKALIDATPLSGKTPLPVHFSGTRSYDEDGSISSYRWDFGDGTSAVGGETDHTYPNSGEYRATLTVTDNQDQSGTASLTIRVDNSPPVAHARADRTSGSDPLTVNFDGSQSKDPDGRIVAYHWDFGDGYSEKTAIASHQYRSPQSYTAVLTVTDDKRMTDTDEIVITVGNEPPVAVIAVSPQQGTSPLSVQVDGSQSRDPDDTDLSFSWNFGDGVSGSGMTAGHTYEEEGTYQISLLVADPHGASDTAYETVEVEPPIPWDIFIVVIVVIGVVVGTMITWHFIHNHPKRKFPEPQVNIDVKSGVEYPAGLENENKELPDISVEVRSGIWKEGEKR